MSESNIDNLIGVIMLLGTLFIVYYFLSGLWNKNEQSVEVQNGATPTQKTIWDKLKIVSITISSVAAFIYAVVKLIEIFKN
nr:hypothetical protein [uncultured Draconibacterium sp.]